MSIFTSINASTNKHDYKFEAKIIKDKFDIVGGADYLNHDWSILELRPKKDNEEYMNCDVLNLSNVIATFRSKFSYGVNEYSNEFLIDFFKQEFERYNVNVINYPWFVQDREMKIITLYVIPRVLWKSIEIDFLTLLYFNEKTFEKIFKVI